MQDPDSRGPGTGNPALPDQDPSVPASYLQAFSASISWGTKLTQRLQFFCSREIGIDIASSFLRTSSAYSPVIRNDRRVCPDKFRDETPHILL